MASHLRQDVGSVAASPPVFVAPDATLRQAARLMWQASIGALVVGDVRHQLGIVSERDVVTRLAQDAEPDTATVATAMTPFTVSARPEDPLSDVAAQMLDHLVRHLPVVDEQGTVVGVVSVRDLLRPLLLDAMGL